MAGQARDRGSSPVYRREEDEGKLTSYLDSAAVLSPQKFAAFADLVLEVGGQERPCHSQLLSRSCTVGRRTSLCSLLPVLSALP